MRQMDEKISIAAGRVSDAVEKLEDEMRLRVAWEQHSQNSRA